MDHRDSRLLDLLPYFRVGPKSLIIKCSRVGLLLFIGFIIGRVTHEKSYIEKSIDRVEQRRAQILQEIQQARAKASGQGRGDGQNIGGQRYAITSRPD